MSAIHGSGYGDKHNWIRGDTEQVNSFPYGGNTGAEKSTFYHCKGCGIGFRHYYDVFGQQDIFNAIKLQCIGEECIPRQDGEGE